MSKLIFIYGIFLTVNLISSQEAQNRRPRHRRLRHSFISTPYRQLNLKTLKIHAPGTHNLTVYINRRPVAQHEIENESYQNQEIKTTNWQSSLITYSLSAFAIGIGLGWLLGDIWHTSKQYNKLLNKLDKLKKQ